MTLALAHALHALAAAIWVGGLAMAQFMLRPALIPLEPAQRLATLARVLARFLPTVGAAAAILLLTGFWMIGAQYGGFAGAPVAVHAMTGIGLLMIGLYLHLWFTSWRRLRAAVAVGDLAAAGRAAATMRRIVLANLILGTVLIALGAGGRWLAI